MPPINADRNLLFGFLGLQMNLVSREGLIASLSAWVLDKSQSLGDILLTQGCLQADELALLEGLVAAHLRKYGEDAGQSLAALVPTEKIARVLERVNDADIQASLHRIGSASTEEDPYRTGDYVPEYPPAQAPRFQILRHYRKGGLGSIFIALDSELNREVALKEIRDEHVDDPRSRSRFLIEAEVTGNLEHPGVVPVYGLGQYPDGRPYYAMRFIRGESLKEAIAHHRANDPGHVDASGRALAFRKLLRRFLNVCDAIEYAHSRGVLHRDLKPSNIMLGPHGETLVVDWGLAKRIGVASPPEAGEPGPVQPSTEPGDQVTIPGSAVGTPHYMSPEQAEGDTDRLGPAGDIYSLGATLYCLMTGRAPLDEPDRPKDVDSILRRVKTGDFPPPRSVDPAIPSGLEAICLKAMALAPEARHASARDLADDVERWLAEEPVAAYREAVARYEGLVEQDPERPNYQEGLARSRSDLGLALHVLARGPEAIAVQADAIDDYQSLVRDHPQVTSYREGLAGAHSTFGRILMGLGEETRAKDAFRAAFNEYERLVKAAPHSLDYRTNLGDLLVSLGRSRADVAEIMETLGRLPKPDALGEGFRPSPHSAPAEEPTSSNEIPATLGGPVKDWDEPGELDGEFGDKYQVIRRLAVGGLGSVWLVRREHTELEVVLKLLRGAQAYDEDSRRWFRREAELTASLIHPNIVPVLDVGWSRSGRPYYTMEYINGPTLMELLDFLHDLRLPAEPPDPIGFRRAIDAFLEICGAMDYAHSRGVLHRDLKPSNILINQKGRAMVVDWGLAKLAGQSEEEGGFSPTSEGDALTTRVGTVLGTPAYMAPEQALGDRGEVDVRTDIYGLGAILFQILTGRPPLLANTANVREALMGLRSGNVPHAATIAPWVPPGLDAICTKAMAFNKEDRYQSVTLLAQDLRTYLGNPNDSRTDQPWYRRLARRLAPRRPDDLEALG